MGKLDRLVNQSFDARDGLRRATEWDGPDGTGRAFHFEHPENRLIARLVIEPIAYMYGFEARRYVARPTPGSNHIQWPYGNKVPDGAIQLHAGSYLDTADLERKVAAILDNFSRHFRLLTWRPDPSAVAYLAAFRSGEREHTRCRELLPDVLWMELAQLDSQVFQPARIRMPRGFSFCLGEHQAFGCVYGLAPAHVCLTAERTTQPQTERFPAITPYGCLLSPQELTEIVEHWFGEALDEAEAGGRYEILSPGQTYLGDVRPGMALLSGGKLDPSKEFVVLMHRRRPHYESFADFIAPLAEPAWRAVYDGTAELMDPVEVMRDRIAEQPGDFGRYRALADVLTKQGQIASANLWLGLGYLRAHRAPTIAEAKLKAARDADSRLPGLVDAFEELSRCRS